MEAKASGPPKGTRAPNRIVIDDVTPCVAGGAYAVKRVVGEPVRVAATVFADGHDEVAVVLSHQPPGARAWVDLPMASVNPGLDRWEAMFTPMERGVHRFRVLGWIDHFASWQHLVRRKIDAGVEVGSDLLTGAALLEAAAADTTKREAAPLLEAATALRAGDLLVVTDPGSPTRPSAAALFRSRLRKADAAAGPVIEVLVERERALFSTWYELFPRSWSPEPGRPGTLRDVADRLDYVADLGFDVLYLPPIHPIGEAFRKGRNNAEQAGPADPGSPWAIGAEAGGHTAVHPDLGTLDDLRHLVKRAADNGIELALDLALQCSPDHPWVTEHPEWFRHRPDGTIQYAENPPKKYQDIYPLDFESVAWRTLWETLLDVVRFWLDQGVTIFRVDNPHTKPFAFWAWLIGEVRATHPGTIFLAEAFTRPAVMQRLGQVGFTQSYTYFAWRQSAQELTEYFTELTTPPSVDQFRPNAWPNTPDILTFQLQGAPREQFAIRLLLAATLSASYGIYGPVFELCENQGTDNGKEEYLDSEKYEVHRWDLGDPASLRELVATVNAIRYGQLALHTNRTLRFHHSENDQLLCFSKTAHDGADPDPSVPARNPVLVVVNLDPVWNQGGTLELDADALGVDPVRPYEVHDLLTDDRYTWTGVRPFVELRPPLAPGHVFRVSQPPAS